eukprot:TRINITY_DN817_c0_g1_i3.p2 TRINITY_DN817_c0_g1~~TRINITY_DN817_c0_g1_i3.p2  ORF type:complete len:121 (+),score=25.29 TRINITY_DN817_c0_g1_i3:133-495(+)
MKAIGVCFLLLITRNAAENAGSSSQEDDRSCQYNDVELKSATKEHSLIQQSSSHSVMNVKKTEKSSEEAEKDPTAIASIVKVIKKKPAPKAAKATKPVKSKAKATASKKKGEGCEGYQTS